MRKFLKISSLVAIALVLVACGGKDEKKTEESSAPPVESSSVVPESVSSVESQAVSSESTPAPAETAEPTADAVKFEFYVDGADKPYETFAVNNAEGMSVKEAMETITGLTFTFNEDEGVIDHIGDHKNNYETGETWAYLLNGQYAELGVVSQKLKAGDTIKWYYGTSDLIPMNLIPAEGEGPAADATDTAAPAETPAPAPEQSSSAE